MNVLKINLTKIFLIYASVNHIRIFHRLFLIYAPVNHIRILQRQFDDGSCFQCTNLTKRIFLIKNRYFIFIEKLLKASSLFDYRILDRRTIGVSDYRSDPVYYCIVSITCTPPLIHYLKIYMGSESVRKRMNHRLVYN